MAAIYSRWRLEQVARAAINRKFAALWESKFWEDRGFTARYTDTTKTGQDNAIRVEVNRIRGFVNSYLGSLFPQRLKAKVEESGDGRGDAEKAGTLVNKWLRAREVEAEAIDGMRGALMYGLAGLKVRVDKRRKLPKDRVRLSVIPCWEMIVDRDAHSRDGVQYMGHVYQIPLAEAHRTFGDRSIKGGARMDAMDAASRTSATKGNDAHLRYVTVLEWYNFVDDYVLGEADPDTGRPLPPGWEPVRQPLSDGTPGAIVQQRGRMEIYLPDEEDGLSCPREVWPLPDTDPASGERLDPVHAMIFVHETHFPMRGLSTVEAVYDQFKELILLRCIQINAARRDARQILLPEGWKLTGESTALFQRGVDGAVLYYQPPMDMAAINIAQVMAKMDFGAVSPNVGNALAAVEMDLSMGTNQAPFTRGSATGASATEVNRLEAYSASEIGMMAMQRDMCLEGVVRHAIRGFVTALSVDGPQAQMTVQLKGDRVPVTVSDLDADFEVTIESGPLSRSEDDAQAQRFLAVLPALTEILKGVQAGNPAAIVVLDEFVERFKLPDELRFRKFLDRMKDIKTEFAVKPQPGQAMPGSGNLPTPTVEGAGGAQGPVPMPEGPQPQSVMDGSAQNGAGGPMNVRA